MLSTAELLKKAFSWAIAVSTIGAGVLWLAYVGQATGQGFDGGRLQWVSTVATLVMGILPMVASFISLRRRKSAALLLLAPATILSLWWAISLGRQRGFQSDLLAAIYSFIPAFWLLIFWLLLVPGMFWLVTSWFNWPPTLSVRISYKRMMVIVPLLCALVVIASATISLQSVHYYECFAPSQLFTRQLSEGQSVFTARVILKGMPRQEEQHRQGPLARYSAFAVVDRHLWGLPWWNKKVVILTAETRVGDSFRAGETYFVDGWRLPGPLTRFMPIYDLSCTRTKRLRDAEIDLRVLRDGAPAKGVRILGRTLRCKGDDECVPAPGAKVDIYSHSTGLFTATSDSAAVYDVSGLPPDIYDVRAAGRVGWNYDCCEINHSPLRDKYVCDCTVSVR